MFSLHEDVVLDPFLGTGTTSLAAMILTRNSIGYEIDSNLIDLFKRKLNNISLVSKEINSNRLDQHIKFIKSYRRNGKNIKYESIYYGFPVITKQEKEILFFSVKNVNDDENNISLDYEKFKY